jgi:hypothetical protein
MSEPSGDGEEDASVPSDPVVLWSYVLEALRTANAGFEVSASPMQVGSMRIEDAVLPEVVNALVGLGEPRWCSTIFVVSPAVRRANLWPG